MQIIYTCPKCGCDLQDIMLASLPAQCFKKCFNCGWESPAKKENVIKIPYNIETDFAILETTPYI